MTDKKAARFIGITSDVAFKLQLDPDIYNAELAPILGVGNTFAGSKVISCSLATATKNGHAVMLKVTATKNQGQINEQSRRIELICDADNVDTAPNELIGKAIKLGNGTNPQTWIITK